MLPISRFGNLVKPLSLYLVICVAFASQGCHVDSNEYLFDKTLNETNQRLLGAMDYQNHWFANRTRKDQRKETIEMCGLINRTDAVIDSEIAYIEKKETFYSGEKLLATCNYIIRLVIEDQNRGRFLAYYQNDSLQSLNHLNKYIAINILICLKDDIHKYFYQKYNTTYDGISKGADYIQTDSITYIIPIAEYNNFQGAEDFNYTLEQVETSSVKMTPESYSLHSDSRLKWIQLQIHRKYRDHNEYYTLKLNRHYKFGEGAGKDYSFERVIYIPETVEPREEQ